MNLYFEQAVNLLGKKGYYFTYTLLEYSSLTFFLWTYIEDRFFRNLIFLASSFFIVFLILFFSFSKIERLDSVAIGIESVILMIYTVSFFYIELKKISDLPVYENVSFWIVVGVLVYIAFTFFFNILANNLDGVNSKKYFFYSYLGDIFKNILFTVAVVLLSQKKQNTNKKQSTSVPFLDMI